MCELAAVPRNQLVFPAARRAYCQRIQKAELLNAVFEECVLGFDVGTALHLEVVVFIVQDVRKVNFHDLARLLCHVVPHGVHHGKAHANAPSRSVPKLGTSSATKAR